MSTEMPSLSPPRDPREYLAWLRQLSTPPRPLRALALLSGGLDSMLAVKIIQQQGVEVVGVNFNTGFCRTEYQRRIGGDSPHPTKPDETRSAAERLGIEMHHVDISLEYMDVVTNPRHGYGSAANPCLDCRGFMLKQAVAQLPKLGAHFLVTGEVLGQRPKSQMRDGLNTVANLGGSAGFLVRPLSAQHLPPTVPEEKGWLDRAKLLGIAGRGRKAQVDLAAQLGVADWPEPAGGCCMLVETAYANRFFDYFKHHGKDAFDYRDITLLRVGRHFRVSPDCKFVVGRNEAENTALQTYAPEAPQLELADRPGPLGAIFGRADAETLTLCAQIMARYAHPAAGEAVAIRLSSRTPLPGNPPEVLTVEAMAEDEAQDLMLTSTPKKRRHRGGRSRLDMESIPKASRDAIAYKAQLERQARGEAEPHTER